MKQNSISKIFDIPQLSYFSFGNIFTGSRGNLSYKISPGDDIRVQIWHGRLCSDLAQIEEEKSFSMSEEGLQEAIRYLESKAK